MDYTQYKFKNNPFRIVPAIYPEEIIWIGMDKIQKDIDRRIDSGIKTSPSRIVLNWGRYGSGKTHAANYYTKTDYIKTKFNSDTKNLKVTLPRSSKEPIQAFLRALIGQMDFNDIIADFQKFNDIYETKSDAIIEAVTQDAVISQLLKLFLGNPQKQKALFPELNEPTYKIALRNYIYGDSSKAILKELNIPLGIENDDEQIVNLISGIFNTITFEKKIYQSIFLWIDEFEDIDTLTKTSQDRFTTFLRQLIDKTPNSLTIFLNFTLKGSGELEDLSIMLGEALMSRTNLYIEFVEPDLNEAKAYIVQLMNHPLYREKDGSVFPFTDETVEYVLKNIGNLSIRKINETFSLILELALLHKPIPQTITKEFIEKIKLELPHWKR